MVVTVVESFEDHELSQKLSSGLDLVLGSRDVLEIGNVNMVEVVVVVVDGKDVFFEAVVVTVVGVVVEVVEVIVVVAITLEVVLIDVVAVVVVLVLAFGIVEVNDIMLILDGFFLVAVGVVVDLVVVETFNTGTTVDIVVVVVKVGLSSLRFLVVSDLLLFGFLVISSFSLSKRNSVPLILIVNGSEVRVILFGDEFIGDSFSADTLDKIVVGALGDEVDNSIVGTAIVDKLGGELDFVRAFISWRIFSYNLRHFSTLRTP